MKERMADIPWRAWLGERLPTMVDRLSERGVMLLAGREPSTERINVHAHPEVCIGLKGRIEIANDGEPIRLGRGQVLVVAPHMLHRSRSLGPSAEMIWISATPNHMGISLARTDRKGHVEALGGVDFLDFEPGNRLITRLLEELLAERPGRLVLCKALLNTLLVHALRRLDTDGRPVPPEDEWSAAEIVTNEARYYIQRNYRHPLTLAQVAHHVALSPNYLAGLFKKQFGLTIIDYLTETRIEQAKQLLAETEKKVAEVADEVGYHSPYYFSRAFKKAVGRSPKAYRDAEKS